MVKYSHQMQKFAAKQKTFSAAPAHSTSVGGFGASALFGFSGYWRCAGWQPSFSGSYRSYSYYRWPSSTLPS